MLKGWGKRAYNSNKQYLWPSNFIYNHSSIGNTVSWQAAGAISYSKGRWRDIWRVYSFLFGRRPESWTRMCFLCLKGSSTRCRASNSILASLTGLQGRGSAFPALTFPASTGQWHSLAAPTKNVFPSFMQKPIPFKPIRSSIPMQTTNAYSQVISLGNRMLVNFQLFNF